MNGRRCSTPTPAGPSLAHLTGRQNEAFERLQKAEAIAPQRIRNSSPIRETVAYLLNRHMRTSPGLELRAMASRIGILQ
jgi:hypothetical protein